MCKETTQAAKAWVVVPGKVKGKARPRVYDGHAITPKDTVLYENWVRQCYMEQDGRFHEGEVAAFLWVYIPIPKSYTKKRRVACMDGREKPMRKPDLDNVAKIVLDSLNGIAYEDDAQVTTLRIKRVWTDGAERVEFGIRDEFPKEDEDGHQIRTAEGLQESLPEMPH